MPENCALCGAPFGSVADLVEHTRTAHPSGEQPKTTAPTPLAAVPAVAADPPPPPADPEFAAVDAAGEPESTPKLTCQFCGATFTDGQKLAEHNRALHLSPSEGVTAE